jgi:predicted nucleotidyltransferase
MGRAPVFVPEDCRKSMGCIPSGSVLVATIDEELNGVLSDLLTRVRSALEDGYMGAYLHGSIAIGGFDQHSDVDFAVIVRAEPDERQLHALQAIHANVFRAPSLWARHLEGSYLTTSGLQCTADAPRHLYLDHGSDRLVWSDHDNTLLHRYVLREHGVALDGPDPNTLLNPVPPEALKAEVEALLDRWMRPFLADPAPLGNGWRQPYTVLTLCRMLYTLRYGAVASKKGAAEWAMSVAHPRWAELIARAWDARPDPALRARTPAAPRDVEETLDFIRYALGLRPEELDALAPTGHAKRGLAAYEGGPPSS